MSNRLSLICFVVAASVPAAARGGSSSPSPSSPPGPLPPAPAPVSAALEPGSATTIGTGQRISLFFVQRGGGAPYPSYVDRALVTWASSDPSRATVDANGNVAGVAEGWTTITAQDQAFSPQSHVQISGAVDRPDTAGGRTGPAPLCDLRSFRSRRRPAARAAGDAWRRRHGHGHGREQPAHEVRPRAADLRGVRRGRRRAPDVQRRSLLRHGLVTEHRRCRVCARGDRRRPSELQHRPCPHFRDGVFQRRQHGASPCLRSRRLAGRHCARGRRLGRV